MDNTIFSNNPPNNQNGNNPPADQGQPPSIQDLYGPSSQQSPQNTPQVANTPPQGPPQPPIQPPPQSYGAQPQNTQPLDIAPPSYAPPPDYTTSMDDSSLPFWKRPKVRLIGGIVVAVFSVLILLMFVSSLFSNKGGGGGQVTLTYWGLWEDSKTMRSVLSDFERQNPNIKVQYSKQDNKKYKDRLLTRINNGTGPDILTFHNSWLPTMSNVLSPLSNEVISSDELKKNYFPVVQKDLVANGALYGLPQGMDTLSLFINKEIFDAAGLQVPQTWEDFVRAAKSLTVKDDTGKIKTAGAALGTVDNIAHASDLASLMLVQNGVNLDKLATASKNSSDALTFYTSFAKDNENVWDETLNPSVLAFSNGELAMMFGYSWDIFQIKAANPSLVFDVYPVPNLPGRKATIASYWVNGISNKSKYQKESLLLMKFLAQKDVIQKLYTESAKTRLFGAPYARVDLAKTLETNPLVAPFVQQASFAQSTYFSSDTNDTAYNERLNAYLGNAIRAMAGGSSAESSVKTLNEGVAQVRGQYGLQ